MDYSRISPLPQGLHAGANTRAVASQQEKEGMVWGQVPFTLKLSPSLGLLLFLLQLQKQLLQISTAKEDPGLT